jgi:hypothetical protein
MRIATAHLESVSPYSQSKHYEADLLEGEDAHAKEARTWRERLHANEHGEIFIPPMSFKNCMSESAKFLSLGVKGKGKATWTKNFEAGVLVFTPIDLGIRKDEVPGEWLFVPSDGKRGGGKRVSKCFPVIHHWKAEVPFHVMDESIPPDIFEKVLENAGQLIGIGRFRPRNNGFYGRFKVLGVKWSDGN